MNSNIQYINPTKKWLHVIFGICLLIAFFLPWVEWNGISVKGYDLPTGNFFSISASQFSLENPFPQLSFTFYIFWLVPALILLSIFLAFNNKKTILSSFIGGALALALFTVFFLFTKTLIDLGVGRNVYQMLQLPSYIAVAAAIGFILTVLPDTGWSKKIIWVVLGPILAFSAYKFGEKKVMAQTHTATDNVPADFSISANDLLNEFVNNDSIANAKYGEKIVVVNGNISQIEKKTDSTTNIRFDHTDGSYIVFSFDKDQYEQVKNINTGDVVSLKGSCSGSIYSAILETTSISFKRSTLYKNKK